MSFEAEKFIFGHIPKCGGVFLKSVSRKCNIIKKTYTDDYNFHAPISVFNEELPILITIRSPYTWYSSMYHFLQRREWLPKDYGESFDEWFDMVTSDNMTLTRKYYDIMGCCRNEDYFIKLENLREGYIKFLVDIGYEVTDRMVSRIRRQKIVNRNHISIELNSKQKEKVRQVDAEIFKRYSFIS